MCCEQNLWKYFMFNIPVSILSALGHILRLGNHLSKNPIGDKGGEYYDSKHIWRTSGQKAQAGGMGMDGEKRVHALQDVWAESRVHPHSGPRNKVFIVQWD